MPKVNLMDARPISSTSVTRDGLPGSNSGSQYSSHPGAGHTPLTLDHLWAAAKQTRVDASPGLDEVEGDKYMKSAAQRLPQLYRELVTRTWEPWPVRRAQIPKGGGEMRPLGVPRFEDKVVQWSIVLDIEPAMDTVFLPCSYGFRRKTGTIRACRRIQDLLLKWQGGYVLDADIRKFFDSMNHQRLLGLLKGMGVAKFHRQLIYKFLKAGVVDDGQWSATTLGTPQGGVISPLLSNVYLHHVLDVWFYQILSPTLQGAAELVRYADDFIVVTKHEADARATWEAITQRFRLFGLELHDTKTRLVDCHLDTGNVTGLGAAR